jgi:putative hemolysin
MRELGRLRERTFRTVQEGSGRALDLDRFDPHYTHLVLWDEAAGAIAGGYRARWLFPPVSLAGMKTLYTASLFRFKKKFFDRCGISMELGRAFVTPEYQRDYAPLLMLWKGIGCLAAMVGARTLFGASSIGLGYAPESIFMLRQHLEERYAAPGLTVLVKGRRKPRPYCGFNPPDAHGLEYKVLDRAVKGLEGDKGLPVLFKQYLQMGGRIAGFHEDREFGTLDALMVVDLAAAPERLLLRYMGEEGLRLMRLAHRGACLSGRSFSSLYKT